MRNDWDLPDNTSKHQNYKNQKGKMQEQVSQQTMFNQTFIMV